MRKEFDYYLISRENNEHHPLLTAAKGCPAYEYEDRFIDNPTCMQFRFGRPVPRKPKVVDYHSTPYSVVSAKIASVLTGMGIAGVQLIPSVVVGKDNEQYPDYYFVNVHNRLEALDRKRAKYRWNDFLKIANPIRKLVLNEDFLAAIPLEERLVFRLKENSTFQLYHQSVVDAIMATQPEGVSFCRVNDWSMGTPFD